MTALLVARPLVLGEDPSFSSSFSDPGTLVLSLLTLCTATAWAGWRFWTQQSRWYAGLVEIGLLLIVAATFASVNVAANKHAAWLTAWEWAILLIGFSTLRQLAVDPAEKQGFLAALLATVACLSIYAGYQASVEIPAMTEALKQQSSDSLPLQDERFREGLRQRAADGHVFGSYAHPNSFASYLVLFIPCLFGVAWLVRHRGNPYLQRMLILALAVIGAGALYLTHSRGAILGLIAAGVVVGVVAGRRWLLANPVYLLVGLLAVVSLGYFLVQSRALTSGLGKNTETAAVRLEYWSATARMLADHPWQGVGAGNFGGHYPAYMAATSTEKIKDPHNLFLEMWATTGLFGLAGLLVFLGAFLWSQRKLVTEPERLLEEDAPVASAPEGQRVRWEFYLGGGIGLLIAFVMRAVGQQPDEIINEAIVAGGRSVIWFLAFALLERVVWPGRLLALVLTVGILAVLANLLVSGGLGYPSVMGMVLAAMALALNSPQPRSVPVSPAYNQVASTAPFPLLFGLTLAYLAGVFYPTTYAVALMRDATLRGRIYLEDRSRPMDERIIKVPDSLRNQGNRFYYEYIQKNIIKPLQEADSLDRWNPRIPTHLAQWKAQLWLFNPADLNLSRESIAYAVQAQRRDPRGQEGYQTEVALRELFARRLEPTSVPGLVLGSGYQVWQRVREQSDPLALEHRKQNRDQHRLAAAALEKLRAYDPTDASLAFQIAQQLAAAEDFQACARMANQALELDARRPAGPHNLTDPQRLLLESWGKMDSAP